MSNKYLKAVLIGGFIVFVWGIVSWMVFPWHQKCLQKFTNESAVASVIKKNAPVDGIYVLPNTLAYDEGTSQSEMHKGMNIMENGPFMFASIKIHGVGKMRITPFIIALITQWIGAFLVVWMFMQTKGLRFREQVAFFTVFGLSVGILCQIPDWNWWGFTFGYAIVNIFDITVGWFLAGLGIAKYLKRK